MQPVYSKKNINIQPKLTINSRGDKYEQEADAMANNIMRMENNASGFAPKTGIIGNSVQRKSTSCKEEKKKPIMRKESSGIGGMQVSSSFSSSLNASKGSGTSLPLNTKIFMENAFSNDFSDVKIHNSGKAKIMSQNINAKAFTHGSDIYFGAGQYSPNTNSGKSLLAHELTHVVQQGNKGNSIQRQPSAAPAAPVALPNSLSAYPQVDRQRIQISWVAVTPTGMFTSLNDFFGTTTVTAGIAVSRNAPNGTLVFGSNIPASPSIATGYDLRHGLSNLAHYIQQTTNHQPLNTTITITLDLTPYGGINGNYRFSYFEHITGTGRAATLSEVSLIEQIGAAATVATVANPTNAAPSGNFSIGSQNFNLTSGWSLQQQAILNQALAQVPANGLAQLSGCTFTIGSTSTAEEGHYSETTHTITIRQSAFNARQNAYQVGTDATRIILHEVAHAIDRRALRLAWAAYDAGGQTTAGRRTMEGTRSLSGSSYVYDATQNSHIQEEGAAETAFRTAVISDRTLRGVTLPQGITQYSATNWEESFGEAFSFYMVDRDLFQQLRPNTFRYFQRNYP